MPNNNFYGASTVGSCFSGRITFDPSRIYVTNGQHPLPIVDISHYDLYLESGTAYALSDSSAALSLVRNSNTGAGSLVKLSTTRYHLYGRFSVRIKAVAVPGIVTTFITMSDSNDEIDWEIVGGSTDTAQTNTFYKGIKEYGVHGGMHDVNQGNEQTEIDDWHTYTIDWTPKAITWAIDGFIVRTYRNTPEEAISPATPPGELWFPNTPSRIQFSVWDAGSEGGSIASWAGGPIQWNKQNAFNATFSHFDIHCYDNKGRYVRKWPNDDAVNPDPVAFIPKTESDDIANMRKRTSSSSTSVYHHTSIKSLMTWSFILASMWVGMFV